MALHLHLQVSSSLALTDSGRSSSAASTALDLLSLTALPADKRRVTAAASTALTVTDATGSVVLQAAGDEQCARAVLRVTSQEGSPADRALTDEAIAQLLALAPPLLPAWLDRRLTLRTFVAARRPTAADAVALQLVTAARLPLTARVKRWANHIEWIRTTNAGKPDESKANKPAVEINFGSLGSFDKMELQDAKVGEVVVRFPPEPSGFLHIGHCKAVLLNDYYRNLYKGKLVVRFDDTNPAKEKTEFVEAILDDLKTMGVTADKVSYTSDYFDHILDCGRKLIEQGDAYVDDTDQDTIRKQRMDRQDNATRTLPVTEQLRRWGEMLKGSEEGRKCVLRAKISMQHENSALRDPALARCVDEPHQRTGTRYHCYPTYDLAIAVVDSLEGVTHAMRDSQYQERLPLYKWVLEKLKLRNISIRQFSRLNFTHTILSKRKMQFFVDKGLVEGWDDPALPTVRGIFNRGLTVEALRTFIIAQGASKSLTNMSMAKLWWGNKKIIDPIAPRYVAISTDSYSVHLDADPAVATAQRSLHPKNPDVGNKTVRYGKQFLIEAADAKLLAEGEEFTLLDWGNAVVVKRDDDRKLLQCRLHLEGDVKTTKRKVSWVVATERSPVVTLTVIGDLITTETLPQKKEGGPEVDWTSVINPNLKTNTLCCGEEAMAGLQRGTRLQIIRRGFFIVHKVGPDGSLTLVDIPDGKEGPASVLVGEKGAAEKQEK